MSLTDADRMMNQLRGRIRGIVSDNSGGVKMTKLVSLLACQSIVGVESGSRATIEDVERAIDEDPTLATHKYVWRGAGEHLREKIFVHEVV